MILGFETLATTALAATPVPDAPLTLCEANEQTVLYGQVQDDFGLDVAVCVSGAEGNPRLTIRWEGEGGGTSVSCPFRECDGLIEYSRYTSPHLTILKLAWREGDHVQQLTQTLSRSDVQSPAQSETRHSWQPAGVTREEALDYPVETTADALALMELETVLENKDWTVPPLSEGAQ